MDLNKKKVALTVSSALNQIDTYEKNSKIDNNNEKFEKKNDRKNQRKTHDELHLPNTKCGTLRKIWVKLCTQEYENDVKKKTLNGT